ncbi:SRPBCC family protein [Candidatus Palauibacter sp.]|uniref:SRPBCC family protein n=1 Tax=Candidatus Palauibacter sp. TaxID=3101350 RepID=UPI003B523B62
MTADADTRVRLSKVIPAPPDTVFRAWTEPEEISRWSAPPGAMVAESRVALAAGGAWKIGMEDEDGVAHTAFGVYRKVDAPNRLVYTWDWEGEHSVGETGVTVEFLAEDGSTRVVVTHEGFPAAEAAEGHRQGWIACLELLAGLFED